MSPALVSVIVPVYNGERYLDATLRSIYAQDYRPIEVLVVDDGSTDGTAAVARAFPEVRYFHRRNGGPAAARNTGLEHAQGELIAFLDADDLWLPGKLTLQVRYLQEHPDIRFVLTRQRVFLEPGIRKPAWVREELLANDSVAWLPSALVARKSLIIEIGGFDTRVQLNEDVEWFFRARERGVQVGVIPEILLHKRVHDRNAGYQARAGRVELLDVIRTSIQRRRTPEA